VGTGAGARWDSYQLYFSDSIAERWTFTPDDLRDLKALLEKVEV